MKRDQYLGIRISQSLRQKLVYIAAYEGRSLTWQVLHLIQDCVRTFEETHGPIDVEDML